MIGSEERRKLIDDYRDALDGRGLVARSVAGLLIVTLITVMGATYAEPDDMNAARARATPDAAKLRASRDAARVRANPDAANARANPEAATVSGKRVATGR